LGDNPAREVTALRIATGARRVAVLAAWAVQALAQSPSQPTFRSGTDAVSIEVGVVDGEGQAVGNLATTDFVVYVDGKPRALEFLTYVDDRSRSGGDRDLRRGPRNWSSNRSSPQSRTVLVVLDRGGLPAATIGPSLEAAAYALAGRGGPRRARGIPGAARWSTSRAKEWSRPPSAPLAGGGSGLALPRGVGEAPRS
jgi:hypothetical protein